MRWLLLGLAVVALAGCGDSDNSGSARTTTTESTVTESETEATPRTADEALSRLPPFDVPASDEVDAYRRAALDAFFDTCITPGWGADKATFEKANRKVLDVLPVFPGARRISQFSIDHRDGNGCLEGTGPPTSYTTYRSFELRTKTPAKSVLDFYRPYLSKSGFAPSGYTACEQTFTRGEAYVALSACNDSLRVTVKALPAVEPPRPPEIPPRPYGAQYAAAEGYGEIPEPTAYEVEPGSTCERISGADVPSIIIPPTPGVRAAYSEEADADGLPKNVVVEWWFDRIVGDCPPSTIHLTLPNPKREQPPFSVPFDVRARSGTAELPVLESFRGTLVLWATAYSFDGMRSRTVSVLIRPRD